MLYVYFNYCIYCILYTRYIKILHDGAMLCTMVYLQLQQLPGLGKLYLIEAHNHLQNIILEFQCFEVGWQNPLLIVQ